MADFSPPFANGGERRAPTADEQTGGFACGPADMELFNWLFWSQQSEIDAVIQAAGLTPSNGDMTQLRQAISALIAAATGGGDTSTYLLMTQARGRLPHFPEVQNGTGHFGIITPATGQIRVPAGVTFLHRGIFPVTTVQTDLATDASKTYHLRWSPTGGFALKDLANNTYNPSALAENNIAFDSAYDDMLVARVVTNSSNVPTITNLVNRDRLAQQAIIAGTNLRASDANGARYDFLNTYNWARTPTSFSLNMAAAQMITTGQPAGADFFIGALQSGVPSVNVFDVDRYRVSQTIMLDYSHALSMHFSARA